MTVREGLRSLALLLCAAFALASELSHAQVGRLYQFSTRSQVLTADGVMIAGFIIGGTTPKRVMVTVAGPSLAPYGIARPLVNPTLTLIHVPDRTLVATNDDWSIQTRPGDIDVISTSGFRPNHELEPAIVATLVPGAYTAIVEGVGGGTGVAVVGVFEIDHPESPLLNLSTRARVLTGEDVLIAGFIIDGTLPQTVVINVAGPSLSNFFGDYLVDPVLALIRGSDRTVIATNDNWQSQSPADLSALLASGFQPNHPNEPAIIATLPPGAYTAIASGAGGGTGIGVIGVFGTNRDMIITSPAAATFQTSQPGTFAVTTIGTPQASSIGHTGTLPAGVTLNYSGGANATLAGTPAAGTGGTYPITINASNGATGSATQSFILTVNQPPAITSANATTFTVGAAGTFAVTKTGFPSPTLSVTGALPSGVSFDPATGVLSGTPAAATGGTYPITFTAANGIGANATQSFVLTVNQAPAITSGAAITFVAGTFGTFTVTTTGFPSQTLAVTGALPNGVSFTPATGVLSGTPAAGTGGIYPLVFTSNNGVAPAASQNFTLTVNQAPAITSANTATFIVGNAGTFSVVVTGFPAPTRSVTGALPSGVTFNAATGVLSGIPGAGTAGTYPLAFGAANGVGANASQNFTLTVNLAPAITSAAAATFVAGTFGSFSVTATGLPTPTLAVTGALPSGVSFTPATGVLAGTPAAGTGGIYPLVVTATNGVGPAATQNFTLVVNQAPSITSANTTTFTVGTPGNFAISTGGFPAPAITLSITLPSGVTFVAGSGTASFGGNAGGGTGGTYVFTITAANGIGTNATQSFTLNVLQGSGAFADAYTAVHDFPLVVAAAGGLLANDTGTPAPVMASVTGSGPPCSAFPCFITSAHGFLSMFADGSFTYTGAINFAGIDSFNYTVSNGVSSSGATVTFTVTNIAPVVDLSGAAAPGIDFGPVGYTENAAPVLIVDPTLTVADADSSQLGSVTVTITNPLDQPNEFLTVTCISPPPNCHNLIGFADVSYVPATGTLVISSVAPLANYEMLLRTLRYQNTSDNPTTTPRIITVKVNDQIADGAPLAQATVVITAVNDAPVLTAPLTATTLVNTAKVFSGGVISVSDADAGTAPVTVNIAATNGTATLATTANLTVGGNPGIAISATGPIADLNNALNGISFNPTPGYSGPASLAFTANDNGNSGTGGAQAAASKLISITVDALPTVSSTIPANGANPVVTSSTISVTFSESVTANPGAFTLQCPVATPFVLTPTSPAALPGTATTFVLTPVSPMPGNVLCTATVVAAQVTDSGGQNLAADHVFSFTTGVPPAITSANSATFTNGAPNTFTVTTTGAPTVTSIVRGGALPASGNVTFTYTTGANGTLSGTPGPADVGTFVLTFTASNGVAPNAVQNPFTLTISCPAITITTASVNTGEFGSAYSAVPFSASGGTGAYSFAVTSGNSGGLAFTGASFGGTPTDAGNLSFTVTATDNVSGCTGTRSYNLTIFIPIPPNATYSMLGNVKIDSSQGPGSPFSFAGTQPTSATINIVSGITPAGGLLSVTTSGPTRGQFTYNPPAGFTGTKSFMYSISSNGLTSAAATVTFNVSGRVWFVSNNAGACPAAPCDGRMTNPFTDTSTFTAANTGSLPNPQDNEAIFVHGGGVDYTNALTLRPGQRLVGQGAAGGLAALGGVTPQNGQTLPSTGSPPRLASLGLSTGNFLHGITLVGNPALSGNAFGTLTINDNVSISTSGTGINLSNGTLSGNFAALVSGGGPLPGNNVTLTNISTVGKFNLGNFPGSGVLGGVNGLVFSGGDGSFSWSGIVDSNNPAGNAILIENKNGGGVEVFGPIGMSLAGNTLLVRNNTGGLFVFAGDTRLYSDTRDAVTLTNNTGATIHFLHGSLGLDIRTTTGTGFRATGGGTISVTGPNNNIVSTSTPGGMLVDVQDVTISGAAFPTSGGLTFKSLQGDGGGTVPKGVYIKNTGSCCSTGAITVTGTGALGIGSAGTISNYRDKGIHIESAYNVNLQLVRLMGNGTANLAPAALCGDAANSNNTGANCAAGLDLQDVSTVTLSSMLISGGKQIGLNGRNVTKLDMFSVEVTGAGDELGEEGIQFSNLTGTMNWFNLNVHDNAAGQVEIRKSDTGPTFLDLNMINPSITNTTFQVAPGGPGIQVGDSGTHSSSVINLDVTNATFARTLGHAIRLEASNNGGVLATFNGGTMTDVGGFADVFSASNNPFGGVHFTLTGFTTAWVDPAHTALVPIRLMRGSASDSMSTTISNNTFGSASLVGSAGPCSACPTIQVTNDSFGTQQVTVQNNSMVHSKNGFINVDTIVSAGPGNGSQMKVKVLNNNIGAADEPANNDYAIQVTSGSTPTDVTNTCAEISGNTIGTGYASVANGGAIRVRNGFAGTLFRIPSYAGGGSDTAAVAAFLNGLNSGTPNAVATINGNTFTGGGTCF